VAEERIHRPVTIPGCPPPGGPPRFVSNIYEDGYGRIKECRPPFRCVKWLPGLQIPDYYDEPPPLPLARERVPCFVTITATPQQLAAVSLPRPGEPLAPRLPREPRQARAPRPPRPPRKPRAARPARRPRRPRRPRAARPRTRPPRTPRPPRGRFYCHYAQYKPTGEWVNIAKTGPLTDDVVAASRARDPGLILVPVRKEQQCADFAGDACARQAAAIIRPLQDLVGWKREPAPTPADLLERRRRTTSRPRPKETATATLAPPPPLDAPVPVPVPGKSYLCWDPRITPPFYRPQGTPCVPPQVPYPE